MIDQKMDLKWSPPEWAACVKDPRDYKTLLISSGDKKETHQIGNKPYVIIGRQDPTGHAEIFLHSNLASRNHAAIFQSAKGQFYLVDLESANGTYLGKQEQQLEAFKPYSWNLMDNKKIRFGPKGDSGCALLKPADYDHSQLQSSKSADTLPQSPKIRNNLRSPSPQATTNGQPIGVNGHVKDKIAMFEAKEKQFSTEGHAATADLKRQRPDNAKGAEASGKRPRVLDGPAVSRQDTESQPLLGAQRPEPKRHANGRNDYDNGHGQGIIDPKRQERLVLNGKQNSHHNGQGMIDPKRQERPELNGKQNDHQRLELNGKLNGHQRLERQEPIGKLNGHQRLEQNGHQRPECAELNGKPNDHANGRANGHVCGTSMPPELQKGVRRLSTAGAPQAPKYTGSDRERDTARCRTNVGAGGSSSSSKGKVTCDKCDGAHPTERCPHFKQDREKHKDAWVNYGRKNPLEMGGNGGNFILKRARLIRQPGDGSCLFHSLCYGLQRVKNEHGHASSLRRELMHFIRRNAQLEIAGDTIEEWVKWDSRSSVNSYAQRMSVQGWGGGIEMAACSRLKNVNVHVYESRRSDQGFKRISCFDCPEARKTIHVLYQGGVHYDAIDPGAMR